MNELQITQTKRCQARKKCSCHAVKVTIKSGMYVALLILQSFYIVHNNNNKHNL